MLLSERSVEEGPAVWGSEMTLCMPQGKSFVLQDCLRPPGVHAAFPTPAMAWPVSHLLFFFRPTYSCLLKHIHAFLQPYWGIIGIQ